MTPFQRFLSVIISILLSIFLMLSVIRLSAPQSAWVTGSYRFFSEVRSVIITAPTTHLTDVFNRMATLWSTAEENAALGKEMDRLALYQATLEEAYRDIEALKQLNALQTTYAQYELINASIGLRSYDSFSHVISIDVGSDEGVSVDDAVISSKGLIGKIVDVQSSSSTVLLLTTEAALNKVTIKIQLDPTKTAEAILEKYDPNAQAYRLKLLDTDSSITVGMKVVTSGLGGAFPSGLLVGTVSKVETLSNAIGLNIEVNPAADFLNIDYVSVVKRP